MMRAMHKIAAGLAYILMCGALTFVGGLVGFGVGASMAPRYRVLPDGTQTSVCGNEYGDPGALVGMAAGLLLGCWLAYRLSRKSLPPAA